MDQLQSFPGDWISLFELFGQGVETDEEVAFLGLHEMNFLGFDQFVDSSRPDAHQGHSLFGSGHLHLLATRRAMG
jgi:hypothetical protein